MKRLFIFFTTIFCTVFFNLSPTFACTDIRIISQDHAVMIGRTMEFALDLHSNLRSANRDKIFSGTAPNGKPGLTWKTKYGYLYLDGAGVDAAIDGLNEKRLSL